MNWILSPATVFAASPVVPVMVIDKVEDAVPMAKALAAGGITVFEITLRTAAALDAIRAIRAAMPEALVGAGTILNPEQYDQAVAAGAQFIISPGFTDKLLAHAAANAVPLIPGVSTPSEIMTALDMGYTHLKFFRQKRTVVHLPYQLFLHHYHRSNSVQPVASARKMSRLIWH